MRFWKRVPALALTVVLALGLSACSKEELREKASDIIIDMATRFGFIGENNNEDDVTKKEAAPGGSVTFPEGFETEGQSLAATLQDGVLYISFKGIRNKNTQYFVSTGDSVTLTAYATSTNSEANTPPQYKAALWLLSEDMQQTTYVEGSTVYFSAAGEGACYSATISGLIPGRRYKVSLSYDTGSYYMTGGMTVSGVSNEDLLNMEDSQA